eukprot:995651-Pelagomonas_calceolata.AAC.1
MSALHPCEPTCMQPCEHLSKWSLCVVLLLQGCNTITGHSVQQVQGKSLHEAPFFQAPCSQVQLMLAVHCGAKSPCVVDAQ